MRKNYDENDPYELGNQDCPPIQLSVKSSKRSLTIHIPWDSSIDDYVDAFYIMLINEAFHPETIHKAFYEFGKEHLCIDD